MVLAAGAALPADQPVRRLALLAFLSATASVVGGPLLGSGRRAPRHLLLAAAGVALAFLPSSVVFGAAAGRALLAGVALAAFLLLTGGLAFALTETRVGPAGAVAVAGLLGMLFVASFHVGDPFLEWGGPNRFAPAAMGVLHAVNPLSGAVGDALGLDWLRLPILYRGFPGGDGTGLTVAPYYPFSYFPWWGTVLLHGGLGGILLLCGGASFPFPRSPADPKIRT